MKYRIKFEKGENVRFLGHLDLMRTFQRIIRRAKLPIKYSEGYNPHQIISFAQPLSVGLISECEYLEMETVENINIDELKEKINKNSPEGINILDVRIVEKNEKKAMAALELARYEVILDKEFKKEDIIKYMDQDKILVIKKTKKKIKEIDIKEDIKEINIDNNILNVLLSAGSVRNIKIDLVLKTLYDFFDESFDIYKMDIKRMGLYKIDNGEIKLL